MADVAGITPLCPIRGRSSGSGPAGEAAAACKGRSHTVAGHARLNRYYWFLLVHAGPGTRLRPQPDHESLTDVRVTRSREPYHVRGLNRWLLRPAT